MASPTTYGDYARVSRAATIARVLETEIVQEGLEPGTHLGTKAYLRQRFSVAAATINEVLRILDDRGVIDARPGPGGGVFVSSPSARTKLSHLVLGFNVADAPFSECLVVRNALEPLVCHDAARLRRPKDSKELRSIVKRMEKAVDDPAEYLRLNWQLHRRLAALSDNATLKSLYLTLLDYVESGLQDVRYDELGDARSNLEIHRGLIEAIIAGVSEELDVAIEAHTPIVERWGDRDH